MGFLDVRSAESREGGKNMAMVQVQQTDAILNMVRESIIDLKKEMQPKQAGTFREPDGTQNGMAMSLGSFHIAGNGLIIAVGLALSTFVASLFTGLLGGLGSTIGAIAGVVEILVGFVFRKYVFKTGGGHDFFTGVFLAGLAKLIGSLTGGLTGGGLTGGTMFGERKIAFREAQYGQSPNNYVKGTGYGSGGTARPIVG